MANSLNLGRVTDLITGFNRISGTGQAGSVDTYRLTTESGFTKDVQITNGRDGTSKFKLTYLGRAENLTGDANDDLFYLINTVLKTDMRKKGMLSGGGTALSPCTYFVVVNGSDADGYDSTTMSNNISLGNVDSGTSYDYSLGVFHGSCNVKTSTASISGFSWEVYDVYLYVLEADNDVTTIDTALSGASLNPVTNKAIFDGVVRLVDDQTIEGVKTFNSNIKTNEVDNTSGNAMLRYKSTEDKIVVGSSTKPLTLMGSGDRPTYSKDGSDFSGNALAFKSEVDTQKNNWNLLWTNLGVGRWANQTFIELFETPINFIDNLAPYYTYKIRMFQKSDFSVYPNCMLPDYQITNEYDCQGMFYEAKGNILTFGNGYITGDILFTNSTFSEILVDKNKTCYLGSGLLNVNRCFSNCPNLTTIGSFDMSRISNGYKLFQWLLESPKVAHIHCKHFKYSFDISPSTAFEEADLVEIISNLDAVSNGAVLTMGTTNLNKLTTDEISVATGKGWTLA